MSDYAIILYEPHSKDVRSGGLELLDDWATVPGAWLWLNISGQPDKSEKKLLSERFGVSDLAIQDTQRERHPPKLEVFDNLLFIMLRDLVTDENTVDQQVVCLSLLLGVNFVVTRHHNPVPAIEKVSNTVRLQTDELAAGPAHVAYMVCRRVVDNYTPVVLGLEEGLAELEERVFEDPGDDVIEQITRFNRTFKQLRRHLANQRDVVAQLRRPTETLPVKLNRQEFNDVFEHLDRLASLCHLNQELASDLLNTHLNLVSHRLNDIMRILTIATVIFLPLSLMAGIYGMNFQSMPELTWRYGYFGVLGIMAVIVLVLVTVFKRRDWL